MDLNLARQLAIKNDSKIVLLVMDGLGGLPHRETGRTELEAAYTPHLDRLAKDSICGFTLPVAPGVTPGSGPGHLALFGYDPLVYQVGRGVLEAVGIDFDLGPDDVAARGNFCTVNEGGTIIDRRAGRIDNESAAALAAELSQIKLDGTQLFVEPVREHRFALVLRGSGLSDAIADTDPQKEGVPPLPAAATSPEGKETAAKVQQFVREAAKILADKHPANMLTLRGFAKRPDWPAVEEVYKIRPAACAYYPMYRGLAKLVGMHALKAAPEIENSIAVVAENWDRYDFFFLHYKYTDSAGEDGDFDRKIEAIEALDVALPQLLDLEPDVMMVGGDHSTPSIMAGHSWHPVPFMLHSQYTPWLDPVDSFNEATLRKGTLGVIPAKEALSLAMAHAGRFTKFGA
ncbi:MAG TPA: 2,3-bisphosphoglycerate-independent phosphoglycerate mutase [Dehalococcoidia bacterium]|nr:2,3-bisphosphoglycerate-independent phosphoglycerate mutase [Dehalococcoidia bacterium]